MLLTTQNNFSEYEIVQTLGLVKGNTVRARHVGKDVMATFRNIVGGEIEEMCIRDRYPVRSVLSKVQKK